MNTSQYELQGIPVVIDMAGEDGAVTGSNCAYVPDGKDSWIPDKLTMVKFIVKVQNCSTEIEKSTVFPICGGWKIRRIACGNYRIYNYTQNPITFSFTGPSIIPDKTIIPFNYDTLQIDVDGIYQVTDNAEVETLQYIFNYCALESCVLEIQKKSLQDHIPHFVITHHAPTHMSIDPVYAHSTINLCYYSDLSNLILDLS